jgi:hypothetical protein
MWSRKRFLAPSEEDERAILEFFRLLGDPAHTKNALSPRLTDELRSSGQAIENTKVFKRPQGQAKKSDPEIPDPTLESHTDAATRGLSVWDWLSNATERFKRMGKKSDEINNAVQSYEELYKKVSSHAEVYLAYLLKWLF